MNVTETIVIGGEYQVFTRLSNCKRRIVSISCLKQNRFWVAGLLAGQQILVLIYL